MKFLFLFELSILVVFYTGEVKSLTPKFECSSSNDPHMKNFNNVPFEFHYAGDFCMYSSNQIIVNAGFKQCYSGSSVYCNCKIEIILNNGDYLRIDTCNGGNSDVNTNVSILNCLDSIPANSMFNNNFWNTLNTYNPSFKCGTTQTGSIAIRTTLPNSNDDILINVYKQANSISQFIIYPALNYMLSSYQNIDKCLCANYTDPNYPPITRFEIKKENFIKCDSILLNKCLKDVIINTRLIDNKQATQLNKFVQDCALDLQAGVKEVGLFQRDFFEATLFEQLLMNFNRPIGNTLEEKIWLNLNDKIDDRLWKVVEKYCVCHKKVPNKDCLIYRKCKKPFSLCV